MGRILSLLKAYMSIKSLLAAVTVVGSLVFAESADGAIIVQNGAFITSTTHFNGFEAAAAYSIYPGARHSEGGIDVSYIGAGSITSSYNMAGDRGWHPAGGGFGYTKIKMADGSDFENIQFLASAAWAYVPITINFRLMNDGLEVGVGSIAREDRTPFYVGFSGLGFDEVYLTGKITDWPTGYDGLMLDSISVQQNAVPEPGTAALFGIGILGALARRRKLRSNQARS